MPQYRDWKPGPPKYEAGMLTTHSRRSLETDGKEALYILFGFFYSLLVLQALLFHISYFFAFVVYCGF
jgi:hypothetical protein